MAKSTSSTDPSVDSDVETPSVGYVGLDHHHAEPYLDTLETLPVTVTCACEPSSGFDAASIENLGNVPIYDDPETLLTEGAVDVVVLTLPNRDAPSVIERALEEGVDVYTEKPVARTASELEPLLDLEAESDATVGVSYNWPGHPISQKLDDLIDEGFFGNIRGFEARYVASQVAFRDDDHYIFDRDASRGGILQWLGIHWIHLLSWLLPSRIDRVNASMVAGADDVDVEDAATLQLETADGAVGTLHAGYYLREGRYDTRVDLYGEDGHSSWDPMGRTFGFDGTTELELESVRDDWASTPHRTITYDYEQSQGYGGAWGRQFIEAYFESRTMDASPPVGLEDALTVLKILDAAYKSAETDQWVAVDR